jgi:protein ImuB
VVRLACVDVPAFPLQLLLRQHPDWKELPVAVVAEDRPQSLLLWVNERARQSRILPGQRYAQALSLSSSLRAGTVAQQDIAKETLSLVDRLRHYTPEIEPSIETPGTFWLNAQGLERLYASLEDWAMAVRKDLATSGFFSTIVVGFTRFGTYAVAKSIPGAKVFQDIGEENAVARRVKLERLSIEPGVRDAFEKLGVRTVADFLRLPAKGLLKRFGIEAHRLHRLAAGDLWTPLQPHPVNEPLERQFLLDAPDSDAERLLFLIKRMLDALLAELASRGKALTELTLRLLLDREGSYGERIRTAAPTVDSAQILGLVRLRLETLRLDSGVVALHLTVCGTKVDAEQSLMFTQKPRRDLEAGSRAFARLRAEYGDQIVMRARLLEGHLPQASFRWEPMEEVTLPAPRKTSHPRLLVRRIYRRPLLLPHRARHEPDGWLLRGLEHGPVTRFDGPYVFSGGWWSGGVHRDYYFVNMHRGEVLWVFYDRKRRRWFLEGRVE